MLRMAPTASLSNWRHVDEAAAWEPGRVLICSRFASGLQTVERLAAVWGVASAVELLTGGSLAGAASLNVVCLV